MGVLTVKGLEGFTAKFKAKRAAVEKEITELRYNIVRDLVEELMGNIPVWSGRTISSIRVNTDGSLAPLTGVLPCNAFAGTNSLPLGAEPERPKAEGLARAQVPNARASIKNSVFLTINSEAWNLVESALAPGTECNAQAKPRNTAVVSEIALATIRSKYQGNVK